MNEALRQVSVAFGGVIIAAFLLVWVAAGILKLVDAINRRRGG